MTEFIGKHYVTPREVSIKTIWIREETRSTTLCIMFPGKGYTTQRPLFHYMTSLVRSEEIDVLQLEYDYTENQLFQSSSYEEQDRWMHEDCSSVIEQFLTEQPYEQTIWVSKSIGTIPMALGWNEGFQKWSPLCGIWLTPLLTERTVEAALHASQVPSLVVIGDQDSEYNQEKIATLKAQQVAVVVVPEANHGLEKASDTLASIEIMKDIMKQVSSFLSPIKEIKMEETP